MVDTVNRFSMRNKRNIYLRQQTKHISQRSPPLSKQKLLISPDVFFRKHCKLFNNNSNKTISMVAFQQICQSSTNVFFRRLCPKWQPFSFYRINDDIIAYAKYIFELHVAIMFLVSQAITSCIPLQLDFWIIPKSVTEMTDMKISDNDDDESSSDPDINEDDDDGNENDDDGNGDEVKIDGNINNVNIHKTINIGFEDIKERLNGYRFEKCEIRPLIFSRTIHKLISNKKCQRIIGIIDRRHERKVDDMFIFVPPSDCNSFNSNPNDLMHESLFQNSRTFLLPGMTAVDGGNIGGNVNIGVGNDLNGHMFCLSFHIHSYREIRTYLYMNGWGTRFFIPDVKYHLADYFVSGMGERLKKELEKNGSLYDLYYKTKHKLCDENFEVFYQNMTGYKVM